MHKKKKLMMPTAKKKRIHQNGKRRVIRKRFRSTKKFPPVRIRFSAMPEMIFSDRNKAHKQKDHNQRNILICILTRWEWSFFFWHTKRTEGIRLLRPDIHGWKGKGDVSEMGIYA